MHRAVTNHYHFLVEIEIIESGESLVLQLRSRSGSTGPFEHINCFFLVFKFVIPHRRLGLAPPTLAPGGGSLARYARAYPLI